MTPAQLIILGMFVFIVVIVTIFIYILRHFGGFRVSKITKEFLDNLKDGGFSVVPVNKWVTVPFFSTRRYVISAGEKNIDGQQLKMWALNTSGADKAVDGGYAGIGQLSLIINFFIFLYRKTQKMYLRPYNRGKLVENFSSVPMYELAYLSTTLPKPITGTIIISNKDQAWRGDNNLVELRQPSGLGTLFASTPGIAAPLPPEIYKYFTDNQKLLSLKLQNDIAVLELGRIDELEDISGSIQPLKDVIRLLS